MTQLVALLCVLGVAAGQVLFKLAADGLTAADGRLLSPGGAILLAALSLYAASTIAWVWVLQRAELGKTYPLMSLAFVLVPLASHFVFGETFSARYALGCALLVAGVILTTL